MRKVSRIKVVLVVELLGSLAGCLFFLIKGDSRGTIGFGFLTVVALILIAAYLCSPALRNWEPFSANTGWTPAPDQLGPTTRFEDWENPEELPTPDEEENEA